MLTRPYTPDPLAVPVRDFTRAGRTFTSAEVEAECCRRVEAAHARVPGLFGEAQR